MRYHLVGVAALVALAAVRSTEAQRSVRPEIRPFIGAYVPTGALRDDFKAATMLGTQVALELNQHFHVLGSVGWTHGHNKFTGISKDVTNIWQYDVGAEANLIQEFGNGFLFRPLVGLGAGGRTYDYTANFSSKTCTAGYGALGAELEKGILAFRLEGRDYLTCFESPVTNAKKTRNDLGITFGLAYHLR